MGRQILIPISDTKSGTKIVKWYFNEVARSGDNVILLFIVPINHSKCANIWVSDADLDEQYAAQSFSESQVSSNHNQETLNELIDQAKKVKSEFSEHFRGGNESLHCANQMSENFDTSSSELVSFEPVTYTAYVRQSSNAGAAIVEAEVEMNATMVIMGTRGLGAIQRVIYGSVSNYVVHNSSLSVIIVPLHTA